MYLYKDLFDIIASFDKSEKRQFKLRIAGQSKTADDYARLFDQLAAMSAWEGDKSEAELRRKWATRLPALARALHGWLLRIMEDMHKETPYQQMWHILLQIDALFERKLYDHAWRHIDVLEEAAERFDVPVMRLFAYNWRVSFLRSVLFGFKDMHTVADLRAFLARGAEILMQVTNAEKADNAVFELLFYYNRLPRGEEQSAAIEALLGDDFFADSNNFKTRGAKLNYFHCKLFYALNKNNYPEVLSVSLDQWAFLETYEDAYNLYHNYFYGTWSNIVMSAAFSGNWAVLQEYHAKLKKLLPILPKTMPFEDLLVEPGELTLLIMYLKTNQKAELEQRYAGYLQLLDTWGPRLAPIRRVQWAYFLALVAYERSDWAQASQLLDAIQDADFQKATFALQVAVRFLNLLLARAQQARRLMVYYGRQLYRWYKQRTDFGLLERRWLNFLRHEALNSPPLKRRAKLDALDAALAAPNLSQHEQELLNYFPLADWCQRTRRNFNS